MATLKTGYGTEVTATISLDSLASSSTLVAGSESNSISNTTTLAVDYLLSGKITTGTSPTANTSIEIWIVSEIEDTPTWPDVFDGTSSGETVTSRNVLLTTGRLAHTIVIDSTSDRTYPIGQLSVAQLFGGNIPRNFVIFVTHNTGVNLNSTTENHQIVLMPILPTVA